MTTNAVVSQVVEVVVKQVWDGAGERIIAELKPEVIGDTVHISLCPPQSQGQSQAPLTDNVLYLANHIG